MKPPVWRDDHIYAAPDDPAIEAAFQEAARALTRLDALLADLPDPAHPVADANALRHLLRAIRREVSGVKTLAWNSQVYGYNRLSQNGRDEEARVLLSRGQQLEATLAQRSKPVDLFWVRAPESLVRTLLQDPELFELAYQIHHDRALQDQWLSLESEQLIEGLAVDGLQGWGDLYDNLVGRLLPVVEGMPMGLAQADNLLAHPDRARRASAWHAIQDAWEAEQETVAAILNAINGWRNELGRQRGKGRRLDALEVTCHQEHITGATLETLMAAAEEHKIGRAHV